MLPEAATVVFCAILTLEPVFLPPLSQSRSFFFHFIARATFNSYTRLGGHCQVMEGRIIMMVRDIAIAFTFT